MTRDALNQSEVESLLAALDHDKKQAAPTPARKPSSAGAAAPNKPREKVSRYDFKRPERVGKEQMRSLQSMHEGFGRNFGAALSGLLRSVVEVKLTSVDQLTYSEFIFSLENPTCFNLLKADPLDGNLVLDINPSILYPIIDRLLGGGRETGAATRRPLTEIELRLVARVTSLFLLELRRAWETVLPLDLSVVRVESNPQLVQIVPPNEVVVLVSFELTLHEDIRGMLNLCIPFNSIERIGGKLTANNWISYGKRENNPETRQQLTTMLNPARVEVVASLTTTKIPTGDLIGLRVGDIIATDHRAQSPVVVSVGGLAKFHARPGALKAFKAVRIEEPLADGSAAKG